MKQFILVVLATLTASVILWAIKANWKIKISPRLANLRSWIALKLHPCHKETPEEAEERRFREMRDNNDIWDEFL